MQAIEQIVNPWQRILVFDSDLVEGPVINDHSPAAILLFDKKHWTAKRRSRWSNEASVL